tara:strand:+ start:134 stop:328 length:195 start_codon:yes stop_codon:yes gene_type:complete
MAIRRARRLAGAKKRRARVEETPAPKAAAVVEEKPKAVAPKAEPKATPKAAPKKKAASSKKKAD